MFLDNHTELNEVSDGRRAFFMGNALVVGVIERIGTALLESMNEEPVQVKKSAEKEGVS